MQPLNLVLQIRRPNVFDEMAPERQRFPTSQEGGFTLVQNSLHERVVVVFDVSRLVGRADARDSPYAFCLLRGGEDCRATKGMPDQQPRVLSGSGHEVHGFDSVPYLERERSFAPIALGVAESEIVEAEHPDAFAGQLFADSASCWTLLAKGEPVDEHAPSPHASCRRIDEAGQTWTAGAGKPSALRHEHDGKTFNHHPYARHEEPAAGILTIGKSNIS